MTLTLDDWIETLLQAHLEIALPSLALASGEVDRFRGSGRLHWNANSPLRVRAQTDGADELLREPLRGAPRGKLLPKDAYISARGQTQDGWSISTNPTPLEGYQVGYNSRFVVWDFTTSGASLIHPRENAGPRILRALMGPSPTRWMRSTETELHSDYFGHRLSKRDWLLATTEFGCVAARQRSQLWFETRIHVDRAPSLPSALDILSAVTAAFGFILARRVLLRGFEDTLPDREERYLSVAEGEPTRNSLLMPLGSDSAYLEHAEALLGRTIDFFMTDLGRTVVHHLALCWDTADNAFPTRLAVASICLEALLRLASEILGCHDRGYTDADRRTVFEWIASKQSGLSPRFVGRLEGFLQALDHARPVDILRDWQRRGVLAVTAEDVRAWDRIRNPATHGRLLIHTMGPDQLQPLLDDLFRILSLVNCVVLLLMGYEGRFKDYSKPGWPETSFPPQASAT